MNQTVILITCSVSVSVLFKLDIGFDLSPDPYCFFHFLKLIPNINFYVLLWAVDHFFISNLVGVHVIDPYVMTRRTPWARTFSASDIMGRTIRTCYYVCQMHLDLIYSLFLPHKIYTFNDLPLLLHPVFVFSRFKFDCWGKSLVFLLIKSFKLSLLASFINCRSSFTDSLMKMISFAKLRWLKCLPLTLITLFLESAFLNISCRHYVSCFVK